MINMMDNYAMNDYIEIQTLFEPTPFESSVTYATFDCNQELFWTGSSDGRVTSYYGPTLSKYTSFKVQSGPNSDIKMIYSQSPADLYILTSDMLSNYSRFGTSNFKHKEVSFKNLQCLFLNQQQRFFLGGFCDFIYDFDIDRLRILRQLSICEEQNDCIMIKSTSQSSNISASGSSSSLSMSGSSQMGSNGLSGGLSNSRNNILCTGSSNGQIIVRDPFSLKSIHKFHPHSGSLSDFDVHGNYLVSCGFSLTRNGNLCVDRFLMVYDLRMMRALTPVQLLIEPCFIHFLPMCSSVVSVASQSCCFQLTDINLMTPSSFYQAQIPPIDGFATSFSMSSNSQCFAFCHSGGSVHLFSKGENVPFNDYSEQTLFVEPPQYNSAFIDINHEMAPISSVPVPLTNEPLISDWPIKNTNQEYRPSPVINQEIMENPRIIHGIISVPNKINMKRNQIFNDAYKKITTDLEKRAAETCLNLESYVKLEEEPKQVETSETDAVKEQGPEKEEANQDVETKTENNPSQNV